MSETKVAARKMVERRGPVTKLSEEQVREIRRLAEQDLGVAFEVREYNVVG